MCSLNLFLIILFQLFNLITSFYIVNDYGSFAQDIYLDSHRSNLINEAAPQFINQLPAEVTFLNETGLILPCPIVGQPKPTIKWLQPSLFDGNSYLLYNNDSNFKKNILRYQRADGSLVFAAHSLLNNKLNERFTVTFQCSGSNKFGTTLSRPIKIKAVTLNTLDQIIVEDVTTIKENNAIFKCKIPTQLDGVIKISGWMVADSNELSKSKEPFTISIGTKKGKYIVLNDGNLLVNSVTSDDSEKIYSCKLSSALPNYVPKPSNWAKLILSDNEKSLKRTNNLSPSNENYDSHLIKQLLRSINILNYELIKMDKIVYSSAKNDFNNKARLYCSFNDFLSLSIKWFKQKSHTNLEPIVANENSQNFNDHFIFEANSNILVINNPKLQDAGLFIAVLTKNLNQNNFNIVCAVELIIRKKLSVEVNLMNPLKKNEDSLHTVQSINCTVSGYPVNQIQFYHDGTLLDTILLTSSSYKSSNEDSSVKSYSLQLNPTFSTNEMNGVYQCFVINDYEIETGSFILMQTKEPPKFTNVFKSQSLNSGQTLSLSCTATGNPLPTIIWTIDRKPLTTINNYLNPNSVITSHSTNPSLNSRLRFGDYVTKSGNHVTSYVNISNVKPDDGGLFACIASSNTDQIQLISNNQNINNQHNDPLIVINEQIIRVHGPPGIKKMENVTVLEGSDLELYCPVYGNPINNRLLWYRIQGNNQNQLPLSARHEIFSNGTLFIRQINRKQDQGFYVCAIENTDLHMSLFVKIIVGPKIEPFAFSKNLEEGMRAVAVCIVSLGDAPLQLSWKKIFSNGSTSFDLQGAKVESINSFTLSLTFQSLSREHSGNYTCIAQNAAAVSEYTAELIVNVSPFWIREPTDQEVIKGNHLLLRCEADGFPPPQIRWKRIEKQQNQLTSRTNTVTTAPVLRQNNFNSEIYTTYRTIISNPHMQILENGSLWINSLSTSDEAEFLCQASNNINPALSKVIKLIVRSPPSFDRHFETIAVKKGDFISLPCNITTGDLPITYRWKRNGVEIINQVSDNQNQIQQQNYESSDNEQLVTNLDHYQLSLENLSNNQYKTKNTLNENIPQLNALTPVGSKHVNEISLTSNVNHLEKILERHWLKLSISAVKRSDSSLFTCEATNKYGQAEKNFRLIVQEKPDYPSTLLIQRVTSNSVTVTWTAPFNGNSPILEYHLQCREVGQSWSRPNSAYYTESLNTTFSNQNTTGCYNYHLSSLENSLTIQNLSSSTDYELRISAKNALGKSDFSEKISFTSLEKAPSIIPVDLEISPLGSKSLKLSWTWPKNFKNNDKFGKSLNKQTVKGYNVAYRHISDLSISSNVNESLNLVSSDLHSALSSTIAPHHLNNDTNQNFIVKSIEASDQEKERFVLLGLRKHSKYEIKVQAYNTAGTGPYSASIFGKTLRYDCPKTPRIVSAKPTISSIELKWSIEGDDPVLGYIINYRGEEREWTSEQVPSTNVHIINDIRCGTKYQFYVVAFNEAGRSEPSEMATIKTQGTAPIAPDKIHFLTPNSTSVSLNLHSWKANGCAILYFIVQYREHSSKQWQLISGEIPPETGVLVISDINPGNWYNLMARAVNQAGATQAEYLFSTLNLDGSTIAPITPFENEQDSDGNLLNNEINSGFRLMNLNVSGTKYMLLQKLNIVLPIFCGLAILTLAAVIIYSYQGKIFSHNNVNEERNLPGLTTGNSNCSSSSASTNNTSSSININSTNLDSSSCLMNELTCGLLSDQQQAMVCPSLAQYQQPTYGDCIVHSINCSEHDYKLCSESNCNMINNTNQNLHQEFATINKNNLRSNITNSLFRSAINNNTNPQTFYPSPYAFSRLNEYRTPTISNDLINRQERANKMINEENSSLCDSNLNATTFKLKPIVNQKNSDQQSFHNYDAPMFHKRVK